MDRMVLIADDCINASAQLTDIIANIPGFRVAARARDGREALKLYATHRPPVVCMDIIMPHMDGLQAARAILRIDPQAAIYMVSSIADVPAKLSQAIALGVRDIIAKPFNGEDIRAMLLV